MALKFKPKKLPLGPEVGVRLGSGQDNVVYDLVEPADKPHLRVPTGWVVKLNHEHTLASKQIRGRDPDPRIAAEQGILYKKNKYDILKYFLGPYIPESAFVLTTEGPPGRQRYVEMTLQQRVPKYSLSDLSPEQKDDPRLLAHVRDLVTRMQVMYQVLGEVNARMGHGVGLDAKLDLGGVSDAVRVEDFDHSFEDREIRNIINTNSSPNLLVDPETMGLYCIDFDQGQWTEGMDAAKAAVFRVAEKKRFQSRLAPDIGRTSTGFIAPS